ncbi:pimeloyl-ACP methyl ester carboxylesterase [Janthinobacterium sp. CG_23.3]|uniref:T6SS effector phospholipase Tle3 domain-containing protein n=1 Tax=Janthinobacterium sp. CG_23.3 TaxID=3349634 RepID=UPI0038D3F8CB
MTDTPAPDTAAPADAAVPAAKPQDDPKNIVVGMKCGPVSFNGEYLDALMQMPLPGVMIFVHGVNSDGEWYEQAENGLCAGLNERLKRCDEHLKFPTTEAGQLKAAKYIAEHTADGFINPKMNPDTFIQTDDTYTPVIRFRWGYKASAEELQKYGRGIYLNEKDYWGGGPFANGCTSLPDLWGPGLDTQLFLSLKVQSLNSTNDRQVYDTPPRPYYVLAALRLAKLVQSLRQKQADLPITIVCHSQGNMIGMAAAFLGDALYQDAGVADTYVLCNAPYSLLDKNDSENYTQGGMKDPEGRGGRQTGAARAKTLATFFDIIRKRNSRQQSVASVDKYMANAAHGFTAQKDRSAHGYQDSTYGRVTLYCNPHDQVISSVSVQGIGWRGLSMAEIKATGGDGVFAQRVFSQGFMVGQAKPGEYRYWEDQHGQPKPKSQEFWHPESQAAEYNVSKAVDANTSVIGKIGAGLMVPFKLVSLLDLRLNALPPEKWTIPLEARPLPVPFMPEAIIFGKSTTDFDTDTDAPGANRNKDAKYAAGDPYGGAKPDDKDAPKGTGQSEAALRYDDHAYLRMRAKREGKYESGDKVTEEDDPHTATAEYTAWRNKTIKNSMAANVDTHATDHSTTMTNPMHAQKALAYDVALGRCTVRGDDLRKLRTAADWRMLKGLDDGDPNKVFFEYFDTGWYKGTSVQKWANDNKSEGRMPAKIENRRENRAPPPRDTGVEYRH